jgi:hypothetical protein
MTHLPFIAAAYGLGLAFPAWLAIDAALRLGRRLAAVDTRARSRSGQ